MIIYYRNKVTPNGLNTNQRYEPVKQHKKGQILGLKLKTKEQTLGTLITRLPQEPLPAIIKPRKRQRTSLDKRSAEDGVGVARMKESGGGTWKAIDRERG